MKYNKVTLKFGKKEFVWQYCPRPIAKAISTIMITIWGFQNYGRIITLIQIYGKDAATEMLSRELGLEDIE